MICQLFSGRVCVIVLFESPTKYFSVTKNGISLKKKGKELKILLLLQILKLFIETSKYGVL